jgi:uncharacterized membrane protein YdfJ with MMPL/SSD domain
MAIGLVMSLVGFAGSAVRGPMSFVAYVALVPTGLLIMGVSAWWAGRSLAGRIIWFVLVLLFGIMLHGAMLVMGLRSLSARGEL